MAIDLSNILINVSEEQAIKNKSPDKMPLNPTAQGWSGQEVRRHLSKALVDPEGSLLSEMKKKLINIQGLFQTILNDGPGNIQYQIDVIREFLDGDLFDLDGLIRPQFIPSGLVSVGVEEPTDNNITLWIDTSE